jgi:uncharacterized RDD family membrane protein YckC
VDTPNQADWMIRFWAWLIDILLVNTIANIVINSFGLLSGIFFDAGGLTSFLAYGSFNQNFFTLIFGIIFFIYWTLFEGYNGQSIGKMVLNIKVTNKNGEKIGFISAALESFGKAFLLPLDCLIGWLAMSGKGLRLFNRISNTIVISIENEDTKITRSLKKKV